jgi:predicted NUDIX family phosphoesterase
MWAKLSSSAGDNGLAVPPYKDPNRRNSPVGLDERVLVVPGSEFDRLGRFQGFSGEADRYLASLLAPGLGSFRARRDVEDDPGFKQIIPYVIFRSADVVFTYRRGKTQGESRLHALRSLGVGGHVAEAYELALRRELDEEVSIGSEGTLRRAGLINDDSNPVGAVHLGVVYVYELDRPSVTPREEGLAEPEFLEVGELRRYWDEFETWSQICIGAMLDPS